MELENFVLEQRELEISREQLDGVPFSYLIDNLLTEEECGIIRSLMTSQDFINTNSGRTETPVFPQRISYRSKLESPGILSELYRRIQPFLVQNISIDTDDKELGAFSKGPWRLLEANPVLSFLRYEPGGVFQKHRDGIYIRHFDARSLFTLLIYLNNDYEGGRTICYSDDENVVHSITPQPGRGFLMLQRNLHEALPVESGNKFVIRMDLIYERDAPFDPLVMERNQQAEAYLQMAIDYERAHRTEQAVECYKKAFRLNPELEFLA